MDEPPDPGVGTTLTELSFAPLPIAVPPTPPATHTPLALAAGPSLVTNVLPSGGAARRRSTGGRAPMIALILLLLMGAAGAAYATGMFDSTKTEDPAPIVKGKAPVAAPKASTPAVVAPPAKPAAARPPRPLAGKTIAVTNASSRTFGAGYTITVPNGWVSQLNAGLEDGSNSDVVISHVRTGQVFMLGTMDPVVMKGPLTPEKAAQLRADFIAASPALKILPGNVRATVGGVAATGFDFTGAVEGRAASVRFVVFERGAVIYGSVWVADPAEFSGSLTTHNRILASVKFAA